MGYPFDKTWESRVDSTDAVEDIIEKLPHAKLCEFKIYRTTKFYQGESPSPPSPSPHGDITWENKIKGFFTDKDKECMKSVPNPIDLGSKKDVTANAPKIYDQVSKGDMPLGEQRWSKQKVADFEKWMNVGCP